MVRDDSFRYERNQMSTEEKLAGAERAAERVREQQMRFEQVRRFVDEGNCLDRSGWPKGWPRIIGLVRAKLPGFDAVQVAEYLERFKPDLYEVICTKHGPFERRSAASGFLGARG